MIPAIGVIVGATGIVVCLYVLTRCAERLGKNQESGWVWLFAAATSVAAIGGILIIVLMIVDLLAIGTSVSGIVP